MHIFVCLFSGSLKSNPIPEKGDHGTWDCEQMPVYIFVSTSFIMHWKKLMFMAEEKYKF